MKTPLSLVIGALLLTACPKEKERERDASSTPAPISTASVRHDCAGIAPTEAAGACPTTSRPTDPLIAASEKMSELVARHRPPPDDWWAPVKRAVAEASEADPESMRYEERVTVQNAALGIAVAAATPEPQVARDAMKIVRRLAFAPEPRAIRSAEAIEAWLGPRARWTERTKPSPLFHEIVNQHTRVFRLVKTAMLRANFSELIAIDTTGAPFVSSVVGSIEIRRGEAPESAACLALPSASRLRCGLYGGLVDVRDLGELPHSHFTRLDEHGQLLCNDCHGNGMSDANPSAIVGVVDIEPSRVEAELAKRRAYVLDSLRLLLEKMPR